MINTYRPKETIKAIQFNKLGNHADVVMITDCRGNESYAFGDDGCEINIGDYIIIDGDVAYIMTKKEFEERYVRID